MKGPFANRDVGWVALQVVLLFALIAAPGEPAKWRAPAGVALLIAVAVFVSALASMGRALSPFPTPAARGELITGGIFKLVRHPIYSAVILGAGAFAIVTQSPARAVITFLLVLFFNAKATYEERLLRERYPLYAAYATGTKRFFPWVY